MGKNLLQQFINGGASVIICVGLMGKPEEGDDWEEGEECMDTCSAHLMMPDGRPDFEQGGFGDSPYDAVRDLEDLLRTEAYVGLMGSMFQAEPVAELDYFRVPAQDVPLLGSPIVVTLDVPDPAKYSGVSCMIGDVEHSAEVPPGAEVMHIGPDGITFD